MSNQRHITLLLDIIYIVLIINIENKSKMNMKVTLLIVRLNMLHNAFTVHFTCALSVKSIKNYFVVQ